METGKKIKEYRKAAHKTQLDLAEAVGVNRVTITKYENGSILPPIDKLEKIASVLACSVADLVDVEKIVAEEIKTIDRAAAVCELAGYKWRPLLREDQQHDGMIHFIDMKTNIEYRVSDELFTAAVNGSLDYIDYNFEKMMKSAERVNNDR